MINCENCPHRKDKSKEFCCGLIGFPVTFLESHKSLFRENGEMKEVGDGTAIVVTPDLICVFYDRETGKCSIYEERPKVCSDYGMIEQLPCIYFKPSGNRRSAGSEKQTRKRVNRFIDKVMKKYGEKL